MNEKKIKCFVIGGSGFIGSRLCNRLYSYKKPFTIIDKVLSCSFPAYSKEVDVRNKNDLRNTITEDSVIVNLAAEHRDDVRPLSLYYDVNVEGAKNICDVAREKNVKKIVFTSTVAVYGFADLGTDENGEINPFNDYGKSKYEAEKVLQQWQNEVPDERVLVIIRPTVVFGEQNRGNVYNLLKQIATNRFVMVGNGENRKSMVYVENIAAFIEYSLKFEPGVHVYNFSDKPDFTMNTLVRKVKGIMGQPEKIKFRVPYFLGYIIGKFFDCFAFVTKKRLSISSIRIKKFCANSVYDTQVSSTGFKSPIAIEDAIVKTVSHEFLNENENNNLYYSE